MTNLSPLLDFLIALVYVLAICSTLLSLCYELVSYWLRSRAYFLHKVLDDVFNDNALNNLNLAELIYNFPQVDFTKRNYNSKPMYISANNFAKSLVHALNDYYTKKNMILPNGSTTPTPNTTLPTAPFQLFEAAVKSLKMSDLKTLMESFINSSGNDFEKLIKNIETWYNDYMDRVTGWFKVRTQKRMIWIAIPVAIIFNLNFLHIGKKLYSDKANTAIIASMAEKFQPPGIDTIKTTSDYKKAVKLKEDLIDSLQTANVPMGWGPENKKYFTTNWFSSIIGWLLMAAAMVMGAPFWYDLLNKLVNMRKAGLKPNTDTSKMSN